MVGETYVVSREEERWWRGRSRLCGLRWDTGDCARGRDWNLRFWLFLKKILAERERSAYRRDILDDGNTTVRIPLRVVVL
jgi:hypothetical protein